MKSTINKKYIKINNNDYNINKELDNFKHRINNLLIIIENFENEYINSEQPKIIKEKLEQIIKNKKYFSYNCNNNYSALKLQKKKSKSIINIENDNNYKNKITSSANNINVIKEKKNKNKSKENRNNINSLNRRIKYSLLLNENSIKKRKLKKSIKSIKINNNKNLTDNKNNKTTDITMNNNNYFLSSKSNEINNVDLIYNKKGIKSNRSDIRKKIIGKNLYLNSYFNKTPKSSKIKKKIN